MHVRSRVNCSTCEVMPHQKLEYAALDSSIGATIVLFSLISFHNVSGLVSRLSQSATCRQTRRAQYWQDSNTHMHMQAQTKCHSLSLNDWLSHSNMVRSQNTASISSSLLPHFNSQPRILNKPYRQAALVFAVGCSPLWCVENNLCSIPKLDI